MKKENHFLERFFSPESVAIVGATNNTFKMNFRIMQNLMDLDFQGTIYPVNPNLDTWNGLKVYDSVVDLPEKVDIVDVFRRSSHILPLAGDVVEAGAKVMWLQQGIVNQEAAEIVSDAGIKVIMDSCIMVEHKSMKLVF